MYKLTSLILLCSITLLIACDNAQEDNNTNSVADNNNATEQPLTPVIKKLEKQEELVAWVNNLNVRSEPNTSGEILTTVKEKEIVRYAGEETEETETIELRNITYNEPWIKVTTKDGKTGWVFKGAIKPKSEINTIDFPYFGKYNLDKWTRGTETESSGGDAESVSVIYTATDNKTLEIEKIELGEYGYVITYILKDEAGKTLRERTISWSVDPNSLIEEVMNYESEPAKKYSRIQQFEQHYAQLSYRPNIAKGEFKVSDITK